MHVGRPGGSALLLFVHFEDEVADVRRALDACAGADGAFEVDDVRDGRVLAPTTALLLHLLCPAQAELSLIHI